jgi:uncharacterized membrane protein
LNPIPSPAAATRPQPKLLLFLLIASMMLVVLVRDRILLDPRNPVWKHYEPFKWWLLPHGIAAALTLLLGPLQFSSSLRRRHLAWHRISGRLYVAGVAIGVPLGIAIEAIKYRIGVAPLRLLIGTTGFGSIFLITTGIAFSLAIRGRIAGHQRWMTRSFAVALVFLEVRCADSIHWLGRLIDIPGEFLETHHISDLWLYVAVSLTVAELVLRSGNKRRPRASASMPA